MTPFGGISASQIAGSGLFGSFTLDRTGLYVTTSNYQIAYAAKNGAGDYTPFADVPMLYASDAGAKATPYANTTLHHLYYTSLFPRASSSRRSARVSRARRSLR